MDLRRFAFFALSLIFVLPYAASQTVASAPTSPTAVAASAPTAVPPLVPYSGIALSSQGKPLSGEASVTFLIYKDEQGGEALWMESQTVAVDGLGHYRVQLGATSPSGLPSDLFATGEARWLEVQIAGEPAQSRVLLASVPYALKAADATTLGGLPASAFALVGPKTGGTVAAGGGTVAAGPNGALPDAGSPVTTTGGTAGYLPKFSGATTILDSEIFDTGSKIGIGTKTPRSLLEGQAAASKALGPVFTLTNTLGGLGAESALDFNTLLPSTAGIYNPMIRIVAQDANQYSDNLLFQSNKPGAQNNGLQTNMVITSAGLVGIGTTTPTSQLQVNGGVTATSFAGSGSGLTGVVASNASELGGLPASAFAQLGASNIFTASQTVNGSLRAASFVGNGSGLTGVTAANASELGGLAPGAYAMLAANNSFTGNQTITGNLSGSGTVSAGVVNAATAFDLGGSLFAFGSQTNRNVSLGFAGNLTTTGTFNTASGYYALSSNTTGVDNTATGAYALLNNTTGDSNTASGGLALYYNTTGYENTASGFAALQSNTTGGENTASGAYALLNNTTGNSNTASGFQALEFNTTGWYNTASGVDALYSNTTGSDNTASGLEALYSNTTGIGNAASGPMRSTTTPRGLATLPAAIMRSTTTPRATPT